ncbi:TetR/AcrR family transcriptional regulator [Vibrio sp. S17_S38]|uniref:TetR/AcrR family transcriptional regulator n=1 Tax=Vibrio sp. S17_S38 TaxID=2720229 RepID=UPI001681589B|nr:TetR/AcrR family transcriptional regulator [Vibrio sp. S17_S38]MBD1573389.1 TetR/AcrR family transcriptional regulator [Vibrio sp. S17_S38]
MNDKRQILLNTALELFYNKGINSIGINEILNVSGIAKKTLYNYFDSKETLVLAALEQRNSIFTTWLDRRLTDSKGNNEVIENLFNALTDWFSGTTEELGDFRGCFFINTSAEFRDQDSKISKYCQYHKQQVRELIGEYLSNPHPELLDAICLLKEGAITTAYVGNDFSTPKKCISVLQQLKM